MTERGEVVMVQLKWLEHGRGLELPAYQSAGAAGFDIRAAVAADKPVTLAAGERALIPSGFSIAVPDGFELQVRPRSGLAMRHGVTVLNAPGTVDSDYRGEVMVLLVNLGGEPFRIERGERIAQGILAPVARAELVEAETLPDTMRGTGGFGSTGR
jgi:dUTP pyrophosphatase